MGDEPGTDLVDDVGRAHWRRGNLIQCVGFD